MTKVLIIRHLELDRSGHLPSDAIDALERLVRPHVFRLPGEPPVSKIWLTSLAYWARETTEGIRRGGDILLSDRLYADDKLGEGKLAEATALVLKQIEGHDVLVVVTHAILTAELPGSVGACPGMEGVHPDKTALTYGCGIIIDTIAKTWQYLEKPR